MSNDVKKRIVVESGVSLEAFEDRCNELAEEGYDMQHFSVCSLPAVYDWKEEDGTVKPAVAYYSAVMVLRNR